MNPKSVLFRDKGVVPIMLALLLAAAPPALGLAQSPSGTEVNVAYLVLVDDSASMSHRPENPAVTSWRPKIEEVRRQMAIFFDSLANNTEVRLFAFAREINIGPKVVIRTDEDRAQLKSFVEALQAKGPETRLWRSVDIVLAEAKELVESQPGLRVRVLAYSDAEDNEKPVPTQPADVLGKYRPLLRESQVQLTYVTIGFELEAEAKQTLENVGVQVRKAVLPEDVVPLQADFRVLPAEVRVGTSVALIDDSIGFIRDRSIDWGDQTPASQGRSPSHIYGRPGDYTVQLSLTSATGQKSTARQKVKVILPPAPVAAFKLSKYETKVGESILAVNESTGADCRYEWSSGEGRSSHVTNPRIGYSQPGEYTVRLIVTDSYGRTNTSERKVTVIGPQKPVAVAVVPDRVDQGTRVRLLDRSSGEITSRTWFVDGREVSSTTDCEIELTEPGRHVVRLVAKGPGGESLAEHAIEVRGPDAPVAAFHVREQVTVDGEVELIDRSTGAIDKRAWMVDGTVVSQTRDAAHRFSTAGDHVIKLDVVGPGGADSIERQIRVVPIATPTADLVIGTPEPRAGDQVLLTDTSQGEIDSAEWYLPGREASLIVDYGAGSSRSIQHAFAEPGDAEIGLVVRGRGGESRTTRTVRVASRHVPPQGLVTVYPTQGRGSLPCQFKNRSSGTVLHTEYDFGDGSPMVRVTGTEDVTHHYGPGEYWAKIRVIGPPEFAPAIVEIAIDVAPPQAAWVRNLWWSIPAGVLLAGGLIFGYRMWRGRREERRQQMLFGTLNFKPQGSPVAPYTSVQLAGVSDEERVPLSATAHAVVRTMTDPTNSGVEHLIEVFAQGVASGPVPLPPNDRTTVGGYEFQLIQA